MSFNLSETLYPILENKGTLLSKLSDQDALIKGIKSTDIIISDYRKQIPDLKPLLTFFSWNNSWK